MSTVPDLARLSARLAARPSLDALPVLVGFDAFIDELTHVVERRESPDVYEPVRSLADFGAWVSSTAGHSGLREAVVTRVAAGGCSLNLGDGLAALGFPLDACIGFEPVRNPVFEPIVQRFRNLLPFPTAPGRTAAYEFSDGKLMLCSTSHFSEITPDRLRQAFADGRYRAAAQNARALVLASWSVYPHMTACWRMLQDEVFAGFTHRPWIFVDLADPASRAPAELADMAAALAGFERIGPVVLSLNGNEANRLAAALGLRPSSADTTDELGALAVSLRERLAITEVGIHRVRDAVSATARGVAHIVGPYCARPRQSVGAGDRFNAGMLAGILLGLTPVEYLATGAATSGFFVREARSPSLVELAAFFQAWAAGTFAEFTV